jgi:hypothetical protein
MRLIVRSLLFAAGFLIGGEALRRWLEREEAVVAAPAPPSPPAARPPAPRPAPSPAKPADGRDPGSMSRAELYELAKELEIEGRSKMSKAELGEAVRRAEAGA